MSMALGSLRNIRLSAACRLALALSLLAICVSCGGSAEPELNYKPDFLPVELSIGKSGVSIEGDDALVTPIGSFSIGARYNLPPANSGSIYVILRDRKTGYDKIFEVRTGGEQFNAVVNGTTSISVTNNQVLIDVTNGAIKKIAFRRVSDQISEHGQGNWLTHLGHGIAVRWDNGLRESWYKPYGLTRWAYSDSTIGKWYGIGFVWFLLRLVLAIVMAFVDTVLTLGFLLGQVGFMIFGPTGRDVIYGLLILIVIIGGISAAASA
jgi:hypothetical protein